MAKVNLEIELSPKLRELFELVAKQQEVICDAVDDLNDQVDWLQTRLSRLERATGLRTPTEEKSGLGGPL